MNPFVFDSSTSKAIAGGIVAALVALAARYGFHPSTESITLLGVVVTALIGYVAGHVVTFFAPANK